MRMLRTSAAFAGVFLTAAAAFAQTAPPSSASTPAPATIRPSPLTMFPEGARFAFIDFQRIASSSATGKLALRLLKEFSDKQFGEIDGRNKQLQALGAKRGAGLLSETALAQLDRDMARLQREIDFLRQNAQAEFDVMQNELQTDLEKRVVPVVVDIAKERGLHAVFTRDASIVYVMPAVDISDDVIKRVDEQPKKQR